MNQISSFASVTLEDACSRFLARAEAIRMRHVIAGTLELGKAAIDELFGGDPTRVHDRAAARQDPLAVLLARHADHLAFLGLSLDGIRTAMTAWEINATLPPQTQGRLTSTQLRVLAVIPGPDRTVLAVQAAQEAWSLAQTRAQVGQFRQDQGLVGKGGRPPLSAEIKGVRAAQRGLAALGDPAVAVGLDAALRKQMRAELEALKRATVAWLAAVK
jgi:hypothetical protein